MVKNKNPKKRQNHDPMDALIQRKAQAFLKAERTYWTKMQSMRQQFRQTEQAYDLDLDVSFPDNISSTVWGLKDGIAFVRHKTVGNNVDVRFRIWKISLEEWGQIGLIVPLEQGDFSLARAGIRGGSGLKLINCTFDNIVVPFAEFSHLRYGDTNNLPTVEQAIIDFQLTLLGILTQNESSMTEGVRSDRTLDILNERANELQALLETDSTEEKLQLFLKQNPFILHPSATAIPKKKLGEDFVTDFVLIATTAQGPTYILVELERSTYNVLNQDKSLSSQASHAIKQTRDWDIWLERNKPYLQNKLPGFETPRYLIVIGRATNLNEDQKAYLRSYNREWKNTELLTSIPSPKIG